MWATYLFHFIFFWCVICSFRTYKQQHLLHEITQNGRCFSDDWVTWGRTRQITESCKMCGHEIQSFFTSYLVPHFSEVWKCGVVWQSKDIVALFPRHEPFVILYLVPHFSEVWKCGKVRQSKDIVVLFPQSWTLCHSLLSSTLPRGLEVWKSLTK